MLLPLMPDAVGRNWDELEPHIRKALGKDAVEEELRSVLEKALLGHIQVWLSYDEKDPNRIPNAVALTKIQICEFTGRKSLLLYSVTRITEIDKDTLARMWLEAFQATSKFAKSKGCKNIVAYTKVKYLADMASQPIYGGDSKYFITLPLGGENG